MGVGGVGGGVGVEEGDVRGGVAWREEEGEGGGEAEDAGADDED